MTRIIRINDCNECPHRDHNGAFGKISYIPMCRAVNKELPYNVVPDGKYHYAERIKEIPDWCPLEPLDKLA